MTCSATSRPGGTRSSPSPIDVVGALPLDTFITKTERRGLAAALDTLLASPTFASWRTGDTLDVASWLTPGPDGKTPAVILSVAHLGGGS